MAGEGDRRPGGWWPEDDEPEPRRDGEGEEDRRRERPRGLASRGTGAKPPSRYSTFVGIAFVAIVVVALVNLLNNDEAGILGISSGEEGLPLAEFAVPDARGDLAGDANIAQDDCESSRNPCPADERRTPACEIDPEGAIRICDLFDRPLAISFWFTRGGDCIPSQDAFDAIAGRFGDRVNFLSVNVRDDRETVTGIVQEGGWRVPVGLDPDGAVSNLYRVGGCPTIAYAYPGGILFDSGTEGDEESIAASVRELLAASRERAEASR